MLTLGGKLKKLRKEKGLTLKEAALELGIATSTLGGYEAGNREPGIDTVNILSRYYKIEPSYLITPELIPEYKWIDFKEFLFKEDISLDGKKLSKNDKEKIFRVTKAIFEE